MENKQHFSLRIQQKILNFPTSDRSKGTSYMGLIFFVGYPTGPFFRFRLISLLFSTVKGDSESPLIRVSSQCQVPVPDQDPMEVRDTPER
jgi:hypothetical protein